MESSGDQLGQRLYLATKFVCLVVMVIAITSTTPAVSNTTTTTTGALLIRRLLRGYERIPPPGGPLVVELGVYINYIYAISEQTMDYSLSMYLRQQWNDSRLAFKLADNNNNTKLKVADHMLDRIWVPDVFFRNEKTALFHKITTPNRLMFVDNEGVVWYVTKITVTLTCPMMLHKYPLDTQGCPMVFSSFDHTLETMELRWLKKKRPVEFDPGGKDDSQFIINDFELRNCSYSNYQENVDGTIPCLEGILVVSRSLGYFMIQFYIPSVLLVILSWVSFWISVDAVVARVNIGLLTVLTLTTQSTNSRDQLPRVSYIKAIDIWMSSCLVFAFASLIEFAVVNVWSRREARNQAAKSRRTELAVKRNAQASGHSRLEKPTVEIPLQKVNSQHASISTLTVPGQPPAGAGASPGSVHRQVSLTRRLSFQLPHKPHPVERATTIDRMSRVIFPLTFLAFNLIYWLVYIL
jgi:cation transporter family protein